MSNRTAALAWAATVAPDQKLFLLALAEVSADMGTTCDFMSASWSMLVELTGLDENTLGKMLMQAFRMPSMEGWGSGLTFRFEQVIERLS